MLCFQEEIFALEDSVPVHYYPEGEQAVSASTSRPLDASNKGFQLLTRMGWGGKGLGRNEHGEYSKLLPLCCCFFEHVTKQPGSDG